MENLKDKEIESMKKTLRKLEGSELRELIWSNMNTMERGMFVYLKISYVLAVAYLAIVASFLIVSLMLFIWG